MPLQHKRYDVTLGAIGDSVPCSAEWQSKGVVIDNTSGCWLYIDPVGRYIPPFTVLWACSYAATAILHVRFVDAPTGGLATALVGGPINVTIFNEPQGYSKGYQYDEQNAWNNLSP